MLDLRLLIELKDELKGSWKFLDQGQCFAFECQDCGTYESDPPPSNSLKWTPSNTDKKKNLFASEVFKAFPDVDEVAREQIGAWFFRINEAWYSNYSPKAELKKFWGMK